MNDSPIAIDLLKGIRAIAGYIGESERRVFYLAETGQIPVFKVGTQWRARKSELAKFYSSEAA